MINAFNQVRPVEIDNDDTYTFGSGQLSPLPTHKPYNDSESYNPPDFSTLDMTRAKRIILRRGVPEEIWNFVDKTCMLYNIDPSHGLEHAYRVTMWSIHILAEISKEINLVNLSIGITDLYDVVIIGGFIHDALDDKYIPPEELIILMQELRDILCGSCDLHIVNAILGAINCMSFSARYLLLSAEEPPIPDSVCIGNERMIMTNMCRLAAHIIADADMLDAYNPMRCRDFRIHKSPEMYRDWKTDPAVRHKLYAGVGGIIRNRVLYYHSVYMFTEAAKKYAIPLHNLAWQWAIAETGDIPDSLLTYHPGTISGMEHRINSTTMSQSTADCESANCMRVVPNDDQLGTVSVK